MRAEQPQVPAQGHAELGSRGVQVRVDQLRVQAQVHAAPGSRRVQAQVPPEPVLAPHPEPPPTRVDPRERGRDDSQHRETEAYPIGVG